MTGPIHFEGCGEHAPQPQKLLSRDFILLFFMALFSNSYIAVFYCFEQWLGQISVSPNWRGVLISSLAAMVFLFRPLASLLMLRRGMLAAMLVSILISSLAMISYPFVQGPHTIECILVLRIVQGIALAFFSSGTVAVLVSCIPKGQSARGFALFSLTGLLPYSTIPALSEQILPLVGGEANLFALTSLLGIPALCMLVVLAPRLRKPEMPAANAGGLAWAELWQAVSHSGLSYIYLACLCFSIMTVQVIFFMKGLCTLTGAHPAWFFCVYTTSIIMVRMFGLHWLDTLPRYRVLPLSCGSLALCMPLFAWGPAWAFVPTAVLYGLCLGLLYPLLAAFVYDRSTPVTRSINSNLMMAAFDASATLAPLLGGLVLDLGFGYRGVFVCSAVAVCLCGLCVMLDGAHRMALARQRHHRHMNRMEGQG